MLDGYDDDGQADEGLAVDAENVELTVIAAERVNFASAQNSVPVLKQVVIANPTDEPLRNLVLSLSSQPAIIRSKTWAVDQISPGEELAVRDLAVDIDMARLSALDEAERGEFCFTLTADDTTLASARCAVDFLARDEWGGVGEMAQILAAFSSPNAPEVAALLKQASRLLEGAGNEVIMNGYQPANPQHVWMQAGAIWSAATALGLSYSHPPASFERAGQKIRTPERIHREGLVTCLDSTLLLAAVIEAAGLNPVVLFSQGHAWVGVWLVQRDFGYVIEPDVVAVRKAVQARELIVLETTYLCQRPSAGFEHTVEGGKRHLDEEREHEFIMAVDIARARAARIRPLAQHRTESDLPGQAHEPSAPAALPKPLDVGLLPGDAVEQAAATPLGRIERWQRKLLDLSLRNRLLNFKPSVQTLPLICPDVAGLEDDLAAGRSIRAYALMEDDPIGDRQVSAVDRKNILEAAARDAFDRGQIACPLVAREMEKRLLTLYRRARSDMQEGGTNTLFLAAGFLRWKRQDGDERTYRAPLLLIPVKLERRSVQSGFRISHHEDEVSFNATLLEFLKRDFDLHIPELAGPLPTDASGIDVPAIFNIMRARVHDVAGFEVVEDVAMATFSFAKYLMWKDLAERTDQLRHNRLVRHLVDTPEDPFVSGEGDARVTGEQLDLRVPPGDLLTPLPADSSQLAAVVAAAAGEDFVLIGPPGTGKSQTISNIIAQCLASGKTVLFVAEKAAALDVVHRRLVAHGLGSAVLQLHSNKTDRKLVLQQLGESWDRAARVSDEQWVRVTDQLRLRRDRLNDYARALHQPGTQGFSIFDAIGWLASQPTGPCLEFAGKDAHDPASFQWLQDQAATLGRTWQVVRDKPALDMVEHSEWSFEWQRELLQSVNTLRQANNDLLAAFADLAAALGLVADMPTDGAHRMLLQALFARLDPGAKDLSALWGTPVSELRQQQSEFARHVDALNNMRGHLSAIYGDQALRTIPLEQLDTDWRQAGVKMWPFSRLAERRCRKLLQSYADSGVADPVEHLTELFQMRRHRQILDDHPMRELAGDPPDTNALSGMIDQLSELRRTLGEMEQYCAEPERFADVSADLASIVPDNLRDRLLTFQKAETVFQDAVTGFQNLGGVVTERDTLTDIRAKLDQLIAQQKNLDDWTRWCEARVQAKNAGLQRVIDLVQGSVEDETVGVVQLFRQAYARWWLPLALDASPELRRFAHWDHEDCIQAFRALDDQAADLAPAEILRRIQHDLPMRDQAPRKSELGVLRHQLGLQRPSMAIRTLLGELKGSFPKLAPCVLMSPLSIAQYLPADQAVFDLVLFDEASQITTWDAIGAIARARQTIIVGDPKQLPPTNFFGRSDDGDDELPEIERDMPSILDEVCAAGIPTRRLDWHYRSRDEALIAFSNHHYYGGGLVTFPAPATGSDALRFHKVDGVYARGGARTNDVEARAIVQDIRKRLVDFLDLEEAARPTIGVITFNVQQQQLILDLLDEERRGDERFEWFFEEAREEPLIVKNLENIQGDERDIMYFSITFGPDASGKLSMNFGALNGDGGEKRLNVAVTRARRELAVYASVTADQIDISRTRYIGVHHLKAFLNYAERGAEVLAASDTGSQGPAENPFEAAVADAFRQKGWQVRTQIGVSGFRIDLGIVNPDLAGAYLAGIECDGAAYHSSATARDRDKVRQAVLEGLGWTILRIWSTEWFRDPASVVERLHGELEELLSEDRARRAAEAEKRAEQEAERLAAEEAAQTAPDGDETESNNDEDHLEVTGESQAISVDDAGEQTRTETDGIPAEATINPGNETRPDFELVAPEPEMPLLVASKAEDPALEERSGLPADAERFFDADYQSTIESMVRQIIETAGPMPLDRLNRMVADRHGWQRTGRRISERIAECLDGVDCHDEDGRIFVWAQNTFADRLPFTGLKGRRIRDVSRSEIIWMADQNIAQLTKSGDQVKELAGMLGISRLSNDARLYLAQCLSWCTETEGPAS